MQETINERIRLIAEKLYKNNVNELCRALGIKQATISNIVAGRMSKPSFEVLSAIIEKSNVSADWLISGKGEMLNKSNPYSPSTHQSGGGNINATYQGSFMEPINTVIGDNNNLGGRAVKNDPKKKDDLKLKAICADLETDLQRCQMENDYLRHKVESLESQLKQALADKERAMADKDKAMAMLDKLINK